jgi:hypothetical protein
MSAPTSEKRVRVIQGEYRVTDDLAWQLACAIRKRGSAA